MVREISSAPGGRLLEWGLATFHTAFFFAVLFTLLYLGGGLGQLLGSLNTLIGVAAFGLFWLTTWWTTRRALRGLHAALGEGRIEFGKWLARGLFWGGVNGVAFFAAALTVAALAALVATLAGRVQDVGGVIAFLLIPGSIVAFLVGAVVGLLFAVLDGGLLELSRRLFRAFGEGR